MKQHGLGLRVVEEVCAGGKKYMGKKYVQEEFLGEESLSEKYVKRKPESAKHRRIFMPIYLTILPGSAAGAAALKFGSAGSTRVR